MSILRRFEREVDEKVRRLFSSPDVQSQSRDIVEIHRGILDEIAAKVQPLRRGKRGFPYNHLIVHVPVPDPDRRALFAMTFSDGDELTADIRDALLQADCDPPPDLRTEVILDEHEMPEAAVKGFHIIYQRRASAPPEQPARAAATTARLTILAGTTSRESYELSGQRVNVGRLAEILDDQHRMIRRNDVVFEEGDGVAGTVSRAHAHIQFDDAMREYRLFDDSSAHGTSLFRGGALIHVPKGSGRGVALRPGDEIYFGRARARFELLTQE